MSPASLQVEAVLGDDGPETRDFIGGGQLTMGKDNMPSGAAYFHLHRARRGGDTALLWVIGEPEGKAPPQLRAALDVVEVQC